MKRVNLCVPSPGAKCKLQCHPQAFFFFIEERNVSFSDPSLKYSQQEIKMDGPAWDSPVCDISGCLDV